MDSPLDVLLVTYNHAQYVRQALDSILAQQTDFPFRIVVADDGSSDTTAEIIREYAAKTPARFLLFLDPEHKGLDHPDRVGFAATRACTAPYMALLEGDDYWLTTTKLQRQVDCLRAHPKAVLCGARAYEWEDRWPCPYAITPRQSPRVLRSYGAWELFTTKWGMRTCTRIYPRWVMDLVPNEFFGDWLMIEYILLKTNFGEICFVDDVLGVYREHAGGVWTGMDSAGQLMANVTMHRRLLPLCRGPAREFMQRSLAGYCESLASCAAVRPGQRVNWAAEAVALHPSNLHYWHMLAAAAGNCVAASCRRLVSRRPAGHP